MYEPEIDETSQSNLYLLRLNYFRINFFFEEREI